MYRRRALQVVGEGVVDEEHRQHACGPGRWLSLHVVAMRKWMCDHVQGVVERETPSGRLWSFRWLTARGRRGRWRSGRGAAARRRFAGRLSSR